ncbi:hypothetical protein ABDK56_05855 [Sphingomonas sp. ASV193]|uniref:hypothetical protein n=1 Tax=Sphingomonas sp. ASV193 TaxID=3144405 RepID=UPI0032E9179B
MRFLVPLIALSVATPALAQTAPPPVIGDPNLGNRISGMAEAMTRAIAGIHTGELRAAVEGRTATARERQRTVGDEIGGPAAVREIQRKVAASGPVIQQATDQLSRSVPAILKAVGDLSAEIDRATANLPNPNYPVR